MECRHCGKTLPESAKRFCPWCGQDLTPAAPPINQQAPPPPPGYQQAPPPPPGYQQAAQVANEAKKVAGQIADEFQKRLDDPTIREAIPGRSLSVAGLAAMAAAILLSATPWFYGIGLLWSIVMLAGGALVAIMELQGAGVRIQGTEAIPPSLFHSLLPPLFAGLVAIHAFLLLSIGIIPILWVAAAGLLVYDQYQKALRAPDSYGRFFDWRLVWQGYRRYLAIGVALCLLSLFFSWSATAGHWSGGYESRYSSSYGGYVSEYNVAKYYWPGWDISGRSMSFVTFAVAALVALVGWSAYRGGAAAPAWFKQAGLGLGGVLLLFWVVNLGSEIGVLIYLIGLLLIGFALAMLYQGKESGPYDMEHLLGNKR